TQKQPGMASLYWAVVDPRHAWMSVSIQWMSVSIQKQPGMAWLYWAVVDPRHAWMNVSTQKPPGMARRYR
ncbi:hypothetical protein, partial [Stenotrophomonas indicatrix]